MTRKGQVTIPIEVRRALGLKRGDKVSFFQEGEIITVRPAQSVAEQTAGILSRYRKQPPLAAEAERAAVERLIAEDVVARMER
jgi:AbrB family looped-hinge helix DNA binding protein